MYVNLCGNKVGVLHIFLFSVTHRGVTVLNIDDNCYTNVQKSVIWWLNHFCWVRQHRLFLVFFGTSHTCMCSHHTKSIIVIIYLCFIRKQYLQSFNNFSVISVAGKEQNSHWIFSSALGFFLYVFKTNKLFFSSPLKERCGTCRLMILWKWRLWTMHCTPFPTRWWFPIRAGSEGATEQVAGRKTASPGILNGRLPSPTQQAAWGMEQRTDGSNIREARYVAGKRKWKVARSTDWESSGMCEGGWKQWWANRAEEQEMHHGVGKVKMENDGRVIIKKIFSQMKLKTFSF